MIYSAFSRQILVAGDAAYSPYAEIPVNPARKATEAAGHQEAAGAGSDFTPVQAEVGRTRLRMASRELGIQGRNERCRDGAC